MSLYRLYKKKSTLIQKKQKLKAKVNQKNQAQNFKKV